MTKDTPDDDQTDQKKKEEDKIKQDKSRAEIIKALVAKGANIKIAGKLHFGIIHSAPHSSQFEGMCLTKSSS